MEYKCRLCLTESYVDDCMMNIFQSKLRYSEATIVDNLYWIFSIEVDVSDNYTKEICQDCLNFLESILKSRQVFQNNQRLLKYQSQDAAPSNICLELQETRKDDSRKELLNSDRVPSSTATSNMLLGSSITLYGNNFLDPNKSNIDFSFPPRLSAFDECDFNLEKELLDVSETCKASKDFNAVDPIEDWTKKTFKKDVGTCTQKVSILPKNSVSVSYDVLEIIGPKVVLEPLDMIVDKEHLKKNSKNTYKKLEEIYDHSDHDNKHHDKWYRYIDTYYSIKTLSVRELILAKSNAEDNSENEAPSSLYNVSNSYVHVCDLCNAVFKSQAWLRNHYKKKHKQLPHWYSDYDEEALREVIGGFS